MTARSFSLGRPGEAQWEQLRASYVLSRRSGGIMLVASDSRDVRDEVRRRLQSMAPRVDVIEPSKGVTLAIHACAKARAQGEKIPVAWIEAPASAPSPESDMQWIEALVLLNQTRDALQMHGPCHVVLAGPRALHRVVTQRAPDLTSFMGVVLLLDETLEELATKSLTWMHLSDLHVHGESWQQDHVLDTLVRDLPKLLGDRELRPDLLFVTGDVAARGQRNEYDGAFIVLEQIAKLLGLDRRQHVFMVPGNHDVDRGRIGRLAKRDHGSLLELGSDELRDAVGELLGDAKDFARYGDRLTEWCAFTDKFLGPARSVSLDRPWRSDVVDVGGLKVGILSLCTAWASGPDDRKRSLILGERQIHDMLAETRDGGAQLTIALMHHPLHWLHDGEHSAIRGRLEREVDVVLHGHVHDAHSALHVGAGSAHVEIGAGAAYAGLGQDPHHGFSVGHLDLAQGRLDVHCFTWSTRSGKWHADSGTPGTDDHGRVSFPFSPAGIAPAATRVGGHDVLATRLRHAAAKVYATVDFAGLGAGGPRRHVTLEQIFVPLRLAAKGLDSADPSWFEGDVEEETVFERGDPEDDVPEDDGDVFRGRGESPEGVIVGAFTRTSGHVSLARLDAMLAAGRKVVVLGGPGSGKSTLTKYLASTIAQREGSLVPLLLTVRDWIAEGKHEALLDMAARQASAKLSVRTHGEALEALCDGGRALLIVDGMDEAADAAVRRDLRTRVQAFVTRFPRMPVLVTSRIAGYHEVPLDSEHVFDELTLEPFDDAALEQFVHRWYDLVEDDPTERLRKRVNLLHAFEVEPRAKELARNPLMATLIGMVHFSHAQLPGDRAKLYGMIIELLLVTWPAERGRELPELPGTVQQPMLEKLALRLQEQRAKEAKGLGQTAEVLVNVTTLEEMLEERLAERFPERGAPERRYLARKWGKWLIDGSGVLQEQQPGRVGFLHLSLMEYLAGRALLEQSLGGGYAAVAELVAKRHDQAVWSETLLLMLGSENKKRELGQAVVERLLASEPGQPSKWSACVFGLALLREDVDIGEQREQLLERTCRAVISKWSERYVASERLGEVVRLSRTHGEAVRQWLEGRVSEATGERLVGVLVMAGVALPWPALPWEDVRPRLAARSDASTVTLTLLDCGPHRREGNWARVEATKDTWASWARMIPLTWVMLRSLESFEYQGTEEIGGVWIAPLMIRSSWVAHVVAHAAERLRNEPKESGRRGLPSTAFWTVPTDMYVGVRLDLSLLGRHPIGLGIEALRTDPLQSFSQRRTEYPEYREYFVLDFALDFAHNVSKYLSLEPMQDLVGRSLLPPTLFFIRHSSRYLEQRLSECLSQDSASDFALDFAREFERNIPFDLAQLFKSDFRTQLSLRDVSETPTISTRALRDRLERAETQDEATVGVVGLLSVLTAETYASLVTGVGLEDSSDATALATLRMQNRWLNLFFTPLVDHATKSRPLPTHPDLHALLLTYGLIQYQTTWEWPDCPHWRAWFSSPPPTHWLPAHVYHLIRSIQDPTNPTHREHATAALDRNDWPELAQALRDNTLVPTPPEILALFDHGSPSNEPAAPQ
jgi:predicted MPP superfamily phosphohydrolase/energy-coupling factor transporter ATP-binding protein EcfA2